MKTWAKISIGLLTVGVVSAGIYLGIQIRKIINSPFKLKSVKDVDISGGEIKFTLITEITNESSISAYVKDQYYEIFFNGKRISKIENKSEIFVGAAHKYDKLGNLKPNDAKIPLKVEIDKQALTNALFTNLTNLVADKSKVKLSLKGYFTWTAGIVQAKQPFELAYTLQEIMDLNKKA